MAKVKEKKSKNSVKASRKSFVQDEDSSEDEIVLETLHDTDSDLDQDSLNKNEEEIKNDSVAKYPISMKLKLLEIVREANKRKSVSYTIALKNLDWTKIKIEGFTTEELKDCFVNSIIKSISKTRTLDEMLTDYQLNFKKLEVKHNAEAPKCPYNPVMQYITQNRNKLKKLYKKEHPNVPEDKIGLKEISSFGSHMFKEKLSDAEREKYSKMYENDLKKFHEEKIRFYEKYPELAITRKDKYKKEKIKNERKKLDGDKPSKKKVKAEKECAYITPFLVFKQELLQQGRAVPHSDALSLYGKMPDEEKLTYIKKVIDMETTREKQFSNSEMEILKYSNGIPKKPVTSYNSFVKDLCQKMVSKEALKIASTEWKALDPEKKKEYEDRYKRELEQWQEIALKRISEMPKEQQAEQLAKYGLLKKIDRAGAKRRQSVYIPSNEDSEISSPKKPKKESKQGAVEFPAEKNFSHAEEFAVKISESPKKENNWKNSSEPIDSNASELASPKKSKFKNFLASLGEYPSLTVAHYFMTKKYAGKPNKIAKSYAKLSRFEKKIMLEAIENEKKEYLKKLKNFLEREPKYAEKVKELHVKQKNAQKENLDWYKSSNTDEESSSENSDDSD